MREKFENAEQKYRKIKSEAAGFQSEIQKLNDDLLAERSKNTDLQSEDISRKIRYEKAKTDLETMTEAYNKLKQDRNVRQMVEAVDNMGLGVNEIKGPSGLTFPQLEKETKRLVKRNEKLTSMITETNDKNRAFQEKLRKYYNLCKQNGLLADKGTYEIEFSSKMVIFYFVVETANRGESRTLRSSNH